MYISKAFIIYIILALLIIGGVTTILLTGPRTDSGIEIERVDSEGEVDSTGDDNIGAGNVSGANDMNGNGQAVPQDPIDFSGFTSPISMKLYQSYLVGGQENSERVLIQPWAVMEDSRCPLDVQCIQAGRVRVAIRFINPETDEVYNTSSKDNTLEIGQKVIANGIEFTLLEVNPHPKAGIKIQDDQYRFILGLKKI